MHKFRNKFLKGFTLAILMVFILSFATACGSKTKEAEKPAEPEQTQEQSSDTTDLTGQKLMIYCGAGMKKPFEEIANAFKTETKCEVEVVYANAAQIQNQINTAQEGDFFVAGSKEEVKPVEENVVTSKDLVKHIPVLAVAKDNPKGIKSLADLKDKKAEVALGDAEATPIGKLSNKALKDQGILEDLNIVTRTTTAPELMTALEVGECDAIIVWKENVNTEKADIVETTDLDKYVKEVPIATLKFTEDTNSKTKKAFLDFLDTDTAKDIWQKHGYEISETK